MNLDKIKQVKTQKFFKKADVIIYIALVCLIVSLFWVFVFGKQTSSLQKVQFLYKENSKETCIFEYDFIKKSYIIDDQWKDKVTVVTDSDGMTVNVLTLNGEFNSVKILDLGKVYVIDADCSFHKDCTKFTPITKGNQAIICVPHSLTILGVGDGIIQDEPSIGG